MAFKKTLKVFFNQELFATLHSDLYPKTERLKKELQELEGDKKAHFQSIEYTAALTFTYKKLSYKAYTSFTLEKLLVERFVSDENIKKVLQMLKDQNYIDDEAFIESYFSSMISKGYGPQKILYKLRQKDLPLTLLQAACHLHYPPLLQEKQLQKLISDNTHLDKERLQALLVRRGFYLSSILPILQEVFKKNLNS